MATNRTKTAKSKIRTKRSKRRTEKDQTSFNKIKSLRKLIKHLKRRWSLPLSPIKRIDDSWGIRQPRFTARFRPNWWSVHYFWLYEIAIRWLRWWRGHTVRKWDSYRINSTWEPLKWNNNCTIKSNWFRYKFKVGHRTIQY